MKERITLYGKEHQVESIEIGDRVNAPYSIKIRHDTYACVDEGTIVGFGLKAIPRYPNKLGVKPGVYENRWWCKIEYDRKINGKKPIEYISSCNIEVLNKEKWRAWLMYCYSPFDHFVQALPETNFYELDSVKLRGKTNSMLIAELNYHKIYENYPYGSLYHLVYDKNNIGTAVLGFAEDKDLSLIERGNIWKLYHDEPLSFKDAKDEADFYINIGGTERFYEDQNGEPWTKENILKEIKTGNIDGFLLDKYRGNIIHIGLKFKNEDLGERVRKMTLKGFNIQ